jgi:hypothetical protein
MQFCRCQNNSLAPACRSIMLESEASLRLVKRNVLPLDFGVSVAD